VHYRNTQQAIATRAALAIYNLWMRLIDPEHFSDTWKNYNPVVNGIIDTHYRMTAANAAQYYTASRVVAGNPHIAVPAVRLDQDYLNKETNIMGPGQFYHFLKENDADTSSGMARDALRGAGARIVMNGGRDTVTKATASDHLARGWERVIEPGACGFCAMLAGRGAVYKESTVDFRAHDHCHCTARAVFIGQESINKDLSDQWASATKGTHGKAAIAAWNRHWESSHGGIGTATAEESPENRPGHAAITGERK
jgi:hypothetical protein